MECHAPERCREIVVDRKKRRRTHLPAVEQLLEDYRDGLDEGTSTLSMTLHSQQREMWRCFSVFQINEAVQFGEIVEFSFRKEAQQYEIVLVWFSKTGRGQYRPMHVVVAIHEQHRNHAVAVTVYDPRTMPWKWSEDFSERICVCQGK